LVGWFSDVSVLFPLRRVKGTVFQNYFIYVLQNRSSARVIWLDTNVDAYIGVELT